MNNSFTIPIRRQDIANSKFGYRAELLAILLYRLLDQIQDHDPHMIEAIEFNRAVLHHESELYCVYLQDFAVIQEMGPAEG